MAWQKILSKQIDVTGTTANQILISDGDNAYWGNSSSSFDSSNLTTGLSGANTAIVNLQTGLSGSNTAITNLTTGLTGSNTNIANITANPVTFQSDVTIQGNVYLRGNTTTFTSNTISFGDSLLSLAANNTINDVIDIGLYGHYNTGSANSHTGLFRSAVSKDWTLFTGYTIDLDGNTTINISDPSFGYANLRLNVANALSVYSNGVELRANDYATLLSAQSNDYSTYTTLNTRINTVQSNISASGAITVVDEGNTLTTALTSITFTGAGVTGSNVGNAVTITIPGGGSSDTSNISMLIGNVANIQVGLSGANTNIVMLTGNIANLQAGLAGANSASVSGNVNAVQSNLTAYAVYANSTFSAGGGAGTGQYTPRVNTSSTGTSVTPDPTAYDIYVYTALANTLTISATSSSPSNGTKLMFRFKDNGISQTLTWATGGTNSYRVIGATLPTSTAAAKVTYVGCVYNSNESYWDVIAVTTQA